MCKNFKYTIFTHGSFYFKDLIYFYKFYDDPLLMFTNSKLSSYKVTINARYILKP
jgi:hypothetical protein